MAISSKYETREDVAVIRNYGQLLVEVNITEHYNMTTYSIETFIKEEFWLKAVVYQ